jgi:2-C-methyl-D-erythritol 4-phosphate cytidylyltransferase
MYSLLLLSGGSGKRTQLDYPKQFHLLNGHPMMAYALIAASKIEKINEIVVNFPPGYKEQTEEIIRAYVPRLPTILVECGATRQESTRILAKNATNDRVILHESARPTVDDRQIAELIAHPGENVSFCAPIYFSLCEVDTDQGQMIRRIDREKTMNIQLPQKFSRDVLSRAHQRAFDQGLSFTEDAMLCKEMTGCDIFYHLGSAANVKITTKEDFLFASAFLSGYHVNV